jgi:hypothetical protein
MKIVMIENGKLLSLVAINICKELILSSLSRKERPWNFHVLHKVHFLLYHLISSSVESAAGDNSASVWLTG